MESLRSRNQLCAIVHLTNGLLCLALSQQSSTIAAVTIPLSTQFLATDSSGDLYQNLVVQWNVPLAAVSSLFALICACSLINNLVNWGSYTCNMKRSVNHNRWYEFALSSSIIVSLILMLFGVRDVYSLVALVSINSAMCLFGDIFEVMNVGHSPKDLDWSAFLFATGAALYSWTLLAVYVGNSPGIVQTVPGFVWGLLLVWGALNGLIPATTFC